MPKSYSFTFDGKTYDVVPYRTTYADGRNITSIVLWDTDGYPFATLSVNLVDEYMLSATPELTFIDTDNCPFAEKFLADNDLGIPYFGIYGYSGFCKYPLYRLDLSKFNELKAG